MTTPLFKATIRRDSQTTTPVCVPMYEMQILKDIFGEENVTIGEQAGEIYVGESASEYNRLSNKYGPEIIGRVYGTAASGHFEQAVERAKKAPAKPGKNAQASEKE